MKKRSDLMMGSVKVREPRPVRGLRAVLLLVVCSLVLTCSALGQDLVGVYLTWKGDPATTMTVNWVDLFEGSSRTVWYRRQGTTEWLSAEGTHTRAGVSTLQVRRVELTGLAPDTSYEFGIGKPPAKETDGWRFRTMPGSLSRPVRFVSGGDMMHSREMVDAMNRRAGALDPDFAMLGGDLAYANGVAATRWVDWLQSWMKNSMGKDRRIIPFVIGIGNHEVKGGYNGRVPDDAPFFYSLFATPEGRSNYVLDFGQYLSVIALDSGHTQPIDGAQADWLGETLAKRPGQQFLFGFYHYPAYGTTKAPKGGLPYDARQSVAIRASWIPHFERYGVTALFENDHHNFKRTHRLRNHKRDDENGLLFLGDGAWGVQPREVPSPEVGWWLAKAEPRNHLFHVELRADGTATIEAVDVKGVVFDRVDLTKPRTRPVGN
ncbi:MAG: fibronectin type III domain-containing protein [Blastocatellia bacterium]